MSFENKVDSYFEDSKRSAYLGHETWWNSFQMNAKMHLHAFIICWFLHSSGIGLLLYVFGGKPFRLLVGYLIQSAINLHLPSFSEIREWWTDAGWRVVFISFLTSPVWLLYPKIITVFKRRAERQAGSKWIRGAKLITADELNKIVDEKKEDARLVIGECRLPVKAETSHILIVGRTGVGKTVLIQNIIDNLIKDPNARGIIYDFKGDMLNNYYNPERDMIFNPTDARTIAFNVFAQIEMVADIDAISAALIPEGYGKDTFFNPAARDVFTGILHHLWHNKRLTNAEIWQMLTMPTPKLAKVLANTKGGERGAAVLGKGDSPQGEGVKGTLMLYTACFGLMKGLKDSDFNISQWLSGEKGGWIFVSNYARISETVKPMLTLFLDLISRVLLSLADDRGRRIYMLIDELPTLHRVGSLPQLLALARSKGGSVWLGTQSISQLRRVYGDNDADTIVNNCATNAVFRLEDPQSTNYFSNKFGEQETEEMDRSLSMGSEDSRDGETLMPRRYTRKLVLPSEIANLNDTYFYLKMPGHDLTKTFVNWRDRQPMAASLVLRQDLNMGKIDRLNDIISARVTTELKTREYDDREKMPEEPRRDSDDYDWERLMQF
jgi:type IV secretory pathway TraG/TraD family ATPase VirD4